VRGEVPETQIGSAFGQGRQIHLEVVDGEFPVNVVEFEFMFVLLVFSKIFRRQLPKGIQIEGTVLVDTLVDVEMLTILLFDKGMPTVRAKQSNRFKI